MVNQAAKTKARRALPAKMREGDVLQQCICGVILRVAGAWTCWCCGTCHRFYDRSPEGRDRVR